MTKKMLQMPRLEHTQSLYNHLMAITQPVGSQGFITEAQEYFLKPATVIYNHSGCFHPHTLVSHQPTWSKLGGIVVTCSVISITVCSFRCAEAPRGDVQGQAVPKGTGQHCVCLRQRIKNVLAQNTVQHRASLLSTRVWNINMVCVGYKYEEYFVTHHPCQFWIFACHAKREKRQFLKPSEGLHQLQG